MKPLRTSAPPYTLLGGMPYTSAAATDLRELFARIRREQEQKRRERDRAIKDADAGIAEQLRDANA